jgi:hypothetical protein
MANGIDTVDGLADDRVIPNVALNHLDAPVDPRRGRAVEYSHVDASGAQGVDHVGADEPGAACDEDPHDRVAVSDTGR